MLVLVCNNASVSFSWHSGQNQLGFCLEGHVGTACHSNAHTHSHTHRERERVREPGCMSECYRVEWSVLVGSWSLVFLPSVRILCHSASLCQPLSFHSLSLSSIDGIVSVVSSRRVSWKPLSDMRVIYSVQYMKLLQWNTKYNKAFHTT